MSPVTVMPIATANASQVPDDNGSLPNTSNDVEGVAAQSAHPTPIAQGDVSATAGVNLAHTHVATFV